MNIVLIGYRCTGKTTIGKHIAERLKRKFVDTDAMIEKRLNSSITRVVKSLGWAEFRKIEKDVVSEVSKLRNVIIATGGGVVLDPENVLSLKRHGILFWLKVDPDEIKRRMKKDIDLDNIRPPLNDKDPIGEVDKILDERIPFYKNAADHVIECTRLSIKEVVDWILKRVGIIGAM